ncbi:MAG: hypothetical protein ACE5OZ_25265, partial [Candidatus Heimdallarchaeota archaeon]
MNLKTTLFCMISAVILLMAFGSIAVHVFPADDAQLSLRDHELENLNFQTSYRFQITVNSLKIIKDHDGLGFGAGEIYFRVNTS